mgnify:CR=1 FL=1
MPQGNSNDRIVMDINKLSSEIIRAAIEVHKALGLDCWNLFMRDAYAMS